jgi:hypothetical protein
MHAEIEEGRKMRKDDEKDEESALFYAILSTSFL